CRGSRRAGIDGSLSGPLSLVEGDRRWAGGANLASQPRFSNSGSARWKTPGPTGVSRSILSGRHTPHGADAALLRETLVAAAPSPEYRVSRFRERDMELTHFPWLTGVFFFLWAYGWGSLCKLFCARRLFRFHTLCASFGLAW